MSRVSRVIVMLRVKVRVNFTLIFRGIICNEQNCIVTATSA